MRTLILLLVAAVTPGVEAAAKQGSGYVDPVTIYGQEARYQVLRDGQVVGSNVMTFVRSGQSLFVSARMELKLRFLAFTVYSYLYESEETWTDSELEALKISVNDDGEQSGLVGQRRGASFVFQGHGKVGEVEGLIFPTNHWNAAVLLQDRVLNTLTGSVNAVRITSQGMEKVRANGADVEATRYRYGGDLETEVWYDDEGRWVGMRFKARDGSTIVYQCERCKADGAS